MREKDPEKDNKIRDTSDPSHSFVSSSPATCICCDGDVTGTSAIFNSIQFNSSSFIWSLTLSLTFIEINVLGPTAAYNTKIQMFYKKKKRKR
jgi:hypothetical protein